MPTAGSVAIAPPLVSALLDVEIATPPPEVPPPPAEEAPEPERPSVPMPAPARPRRQATTPPVAPAPARHRDEPQDAPAGPTSDLDAPDAAPEFAASGPLDFTDSAVVLRAGGGPPGAGAALVGGAGHRSAGGGLTTREPPTAGAPGLAHLASLTGAGDWDCPFPRDADRAGIHQAVVDLHIAVDQLGRPRRIQILREPGHGFGPAARRCARSKRFQPARDRDGHPVTGVVTVRVRFLR